jgi:hypothetical protein
MSELKQLKIKRRMRSLVVRSLAYTMPGRGDFGDCLANKQYKPEFPSGPGDLRMV